MQSLYSDLRWTWRLMRRRPAFTAAVVVTLSVTIAAAATAFGLARAVLWKPLPFHEAGRLAFVWEDVAREGAPEPFRVTGARFVEWRGNQSSFASMAAFGAAAFTAAGPAGTVTIRGVRVTPNFFDTLGIAPVLGRTFVQADEVPGQHRVAVLSHALWQEWMGGRAEAVGATLRLNDEAYTVIGVMPPAVYPGWPLNPATVTLDPDDRRLWIPIAATPQWLSNNRAHLNGVVARLAPGVTLERAADELNALTSGASADPHRARVMPLREQFVRNARLPLLVLLGTSLAVLVVACANLAALQVSAMEARRGELGIRTALGAGRARLARQLATESFAMAAAGALAGGVLARVALTGLPSILPPTVPFLTAPSFDWRVAAFGAVIALLAGLALGAWPLVRSLAASPSPRGTRIGSRSTVYRALVVVQVSLATALVVAASLLARSLGTVSDRDPGFVIDRVLVADVSFPAPSYDTAARVAAAERRLGAELARIPGAAGVAFSYDHPLEANWTDVFRVAGGQPGRDDVGGSAQLRIVSPGYFDTMRVEVIEGRGFTGRDDLASPGAMVVNESFVRQARNGSLLGRRVSSGTPRFNWGDGVPAEFTIVGVVEDERFRGLEEPSQPAVYMSTQQFPQRGAVALVRTTGEPGAAAPDVRGTLRGFDAAMPLGRITTLADILSEQLVERRATTGVIAGLAGTSLALAALGLYGLVAMIVSSRTREIGVRLALGAVPAAIARGVVGDSVRPALAGVAVGIGLALAGGRLLERLLVGVTPRDPATIAIVAVTLVAVAALAAVVPAARAARIDANVALKSE